MKEEEVIDEKMNAGLRAYLDKKMKGKKNGDKEEMVMVRMVRHLKDLNQTSLT